MKSKIRGPVIAFGADGKGRYAFAKDGRIELSRDFGNLLDLENLERYERSVRALIKKQRPEIFACDLHPEYNSTKLAHKLHKLFTIRYPLVTIQHHHAHIASSMADNRLHGSVIGAAFDGTGFGSDGNVWGGEFLIATPDTFKRAAHLEYVSMPGGEAAIKEPWRMALSYLYRFYGENFLKLKIPFVESINKKNAQKRKALIIADMVKKNINSPLTSSMGRLFDAVSSLVNGSKDVSCEGQAAAGLEKLAKASVDESDYYKISFRTEDKKIIIATKDLIDGIVKDIALHVKAEKIAIRFHNSVARIIYDVSLKLAKIHNIKKIVLSGGVFQNEILLMKTRRLFKNSQFLLYFHKNVPASDAGLAVGQAFIAGRRY